MAFHLVAFHANQDEAGAYTNVAPITDPTVTINGNYLYVPVLNKLLGVYVAGGSTATGAYLQSPSLRRLLNLDIIPIEQAITPTGDESFQFFGDNPITLDQYEGLEAYLKADPAAAERHTVLVWFGDAAVVPVGGDIRTIRADASISATVGAWTSGALTFRQTLPVGTYRVVGASCYGAGLVAFRFIPVGYAWRPGGLAITNRGAKAHDKQRNGGMGAWFDFDSKTPPTLEVLAASANSAQEVYLDVIKVA
jgi:hypothetical protein